MRAHSDRVSALIAGGGPVGLTLGLLLDRRGIDCLVWSGGLARQCCRGPPG